MTLDLAAPVDAHDHVTGMGGGRELVVYGDFECPYTAAAMREIGRLRDAGAGFGLVFRNLPLREIHAHAQAAAEAAEAAARQDRYWEMADILFRNQMRLEPDDLRRFAETWPGRRPLRSGLCRSGRRRPDRTRRRERPAERGRRYADAVHRRHAL